MVLNKLQSDGRTRISHEIRSPLSWPVTIKSSIGLQTALVIFEFFGVTSIWHTGVAFSENFSKKAIDNYLTKIWKQNQKSNRTWFSYISHEQITFFWHGTIGWIQYQIATVWESTCTHWIRQDVVCFHLTRTTVPQFTCAVSWASQKVQRFPFLSKSSI